jgi:hypothetical protein
MITASNNLKNLLYKNSSIKIDTGCTIEYNMNTMMNLVNASYDTSLESQYQRDPSGRINLFKKLFPVDSIIKPFRPTGPGIKYFILLPNDTTTNSFSNYRMVNYPGTVSSQAVTAQPRLYYPGVTTAYKYWVTPKNGNVDITVDYVPSGNKYALTNKIIATFEKYHTNPTNYTITITKSDNTTITVGPISTPSNGKVILYYNGTSWGTTAWTEPISYPEPIAIKKVRLQATNPGGDKIVGVIELSARWVKDISSDVVSFNISKESSASSEDILPVGLLTSNSLSLELNKYNESELKYITYDPSLTLSSSKMYMFKNAELKPYFKIYHSNGAITSGSDKYDKIEQGSFFINDWSISEYGDVSVMSLDSAKYLIETFAPDILCEQYPVTAILRRLLDSVGFNNYNFNIANTETSIPLINYFWTDPSLTVWEHIQQLCRDIQMNAIVDENNILQFYSRDYMYSRTTKDWNFYYDSDLNGILPNIIEFSQKEIPAVNKVKIIWRTPTSSNYVGASGQLWNSQPNFLSAGSLKTAISTSDMEIEMDTTILDNYSKYQSIFNFNGYFLIDSEILEFEAIGYQYVPFDSNVFQNIWIYSPADISKYRAISKPGYENPNLPETSYFKPNGKYKIKTRGALGTTAAYHSASGSASGMLSQWTGRLVELK